MYAKNSDDENLIKEINITIANAVPKWKTASISEMEDIYIGNVLNLGSSTSLSRSEMLATPWKTFNSLWGVHDFNELGLADFFIDLEVQMESNVLSELYEGGYPFLACTPYLSWNGNSLIQMYRERLGL